MMKNRRFAGMLALMLCMGAFLLPTTVFAQTDKDTTPPTLAAKLDEGTLAVEAKDEESGVQAVYVDNNRINSLVDGKASVLLKDYAGNSKQVSLYAVDYAGNRSEPVKLENPYYTAPASLPAASQPASSQPAAAPSSPQPPASSSAPASSSVPPASSSEPSAVTSSAEENPMTPDGQGTVIDSATDADGREFYTIMTPEGNVFYLVIDRIKGTQNVYFLNAVTESDLRALAEKDKSGSGQSTVPIPESTSQPASNSSSDSEPEPPAQTATDSDTGTVILIALAALVAGAAGYYFKILKPKKQAFMEDEFEEEYEEEEIDEALDSGDTVEDTYSTEEEDDWSKEEYELDIEPEDDEM